MGMPPHDGPPAHRAAAERYLIGPEIGRGGMAVVHAARDRTTGARVALKRLRPESTADRDLRARITREMRAMSRVQHPNVVAIHDAGHDDDGPWIAMDLCTGGSLGDRLRDGPLTAAGAHDLADQVLAGLAALHAAGLVHRDITPQNILRDDERWRIADLGIAHDTAPDTTAVTGTGLIVGTPAYMAPEHVTGSPVGAPADLYALGCVLHHALTGAPPHHADNGLRLAMLHATEPAPALPASVAAADPHLAALVGALMRKDPAARPDAARAAAILAGAASAVDEPATMRLIAPVPHRRARTVRRALAALGAAAAIALGAAWMSAGDDSGDTTTTPALTTAPAARTAASSPAPPPAPVTITRTATTPAPTVVDTPGPGNNGRGKAKGHEKQKKKKNDKKAKKGATPR